MARSVRFHPAALRDAEEAVAWYAGQSDELKLIFLWFATWKNGVMDYAPAWMKADAKRFKRVVATNGKPIWVLSSHCRANLEADKNAFKALCRHLKDIDSAEQTVIGLQVENEPGTSAATGITGRKVRPYFEITPRDPQH